MLVKIGSPSSCFSLFLVPSFFFPFEFNFLSCYCRFRTKDKRILKQKVTLTRSTNQSHTVMTFYLAWISKEIKLIGKKITNNRSSNCSLNLHSSCINSPTSSCICTCEMNNLFYCSSVQKKLFDINVKSWFQNYVVINTL